MQSYHLVYTWWLQNFLRINLFLSKTKEYNYLSYISSKTVHLCKYTLLPATVNVLETFLEAIL